MIEIRFTKSGVVGIGRRALQEVGRAAIRKAAEFWHANFLPIHFTKRASRRYGYEYREGEATLKPGSYSWMKLHRKTIAGVKAIGEVKPFVWSGRSRASATSTRKFEAVAPNYTTYEGRAIINAPAINFVERGYEELTRTTPDEDAAMRDVFLAEYERQLNSRGRTQTTTFKAAA